MKNLAFIFILGFVGCSSDSRKSPEEQIESLDDSQPKKIVEVKYDSRTDYFKQNNDDTKTDVLAVESLARFDSGRLDVAIDSEDPMNQGISYCYKRDFERGLAVFKKVYGEYKKHPSYYNQLGTCYFLKGDYIKASLFYNKALVIDKGYAPAYNNIGVIHLKEKDDLSARNSFQKAMSLSPTAKTPRYNLAQIYLQAGFTEEALTIFNGLLNTPSEGQASDIDVVIGLANAYLLKGDSTKSLSYFKSLENKYWQRPDVGINFAVALKLSGDNKNALKVFRNVDQGRVMSWATYYKKVSQFLGGE